MGLLQESDFNILDKSGEAEYYKTNKNTLLFICLLFYFLSSMYQLPLAMYDRLRA